MADNDAFYNQIFTALKPVKDPELNKSLVELGMIKDLKACDGNVAFTIELTTPACPLKSVIEQDCRKALASLPGIKQINITFGAQVRQARTGMQNIPGVKNVILVASGKGGVGKSTVATNLACQLATMGAKTGLLDADVYGPSIPKMMGFSMAPVVKDGKILPLVAHGVSMMSMGFFVEEGRPVIWRGPMLHGAIKQFVSEVAWGDLDYLVVDLPPGTGDVQLSLAQSVGVAGAVIVSTPQQVALIDVIKALNMFRQPAVNIPILGVVENMTGAIFGEGGARKFAEREGVPFLGSIPLEANVVECGDKGSPVSIDQPNSTAAKAFREIAQKTAAQVSMNHERGVQSKPIEIVR